MKHRVRRAFASATIGALCASLGVVALVHTAAADTGPQPRSEAPRPAEKQLAPSPDDGGNVQPQVVAGSPYSTTYFPWQAAILYGPTTPDESGPVVLYHNDPYLDQHCGGALIDPEWVITAAHCIVRDSAQPNPGTNDQPTEVQVVLGHDTLSSATGGSDRRAVDQVITHSSFNSSSFENDYGLLHLATPATGIPTLSYTTNTSSEGAGTVAYYAGWGATDANATTYPDQLQVGFGVVLTSPSTLDCGLWATAPGSGQTGYYKDNMLCVGQGFAGGNPSGCIGDDGDPLVVGNPGGWKLIGIAINGPFPCGQGLPDLYSRVSTVASSFIDANLGTHGTTGTYHPITPVRLVDTRNNTGKLGTNGAVTPQGTINPQVEGWTGTPVPIDGTAVAVVLNVAVTGPSANGWLTIFPTGSALPTAASMNFAAGQTIANGVTVALGQGGKISINNTGGNPGAGYVHIIVDLVGWYQNNASGALFNGLSEPTRVADTRFGSSTPQTSGDNARNTPLAGNETDTFKVCGGNTNVPDPGASTVVANFTVIAGGTNGWITVWDTGAAPTAASLNYSANGTIANLVTVKIGPSCGIKIGNSVGAAGIAPVHVIIDIVGYYSPEGSGTGLQFHPLVPVRLVDTRSGTTANPGLNTAVPAQGTIAPTVRNVATVPAGAQAIILNTAVTGPSAYGWITVFTAPGTPPTAASLSFFPGQTIANGVIIAIHTDDKVRAANSFGLGTAGPVHVIMDATGYFS